MSVELSGARVLLTGATGGLGREMARALAERGATLWLSARDEHKLSDLAEELPGEHRVAAADLSEAGAGTELVERVGELDVVVANAGVGDGGSIDSFSSNKLTTAVRINFESPIAIAQAALPSMRERNRGQLVFVSSLAGRVARGESSVYGATKAGLRAFGLALREDLRGTEVGASVVMPGFIREVGMFARSGASLPNLLTSRADEVAAAVVKAIDDDRGEVEVAPRVVRVGARVAGAAPEAVGRIGRAVGRFT